MTKTFNCHNQISIKYLLRNEYCTCDKLKDVLTSVSMVLHI